MTIVDAGDNQFSPSNLPSPPGWHDALNNAGEEIPAHAVVEIDGSGAFRNSQYYMTVKKPAGGDDSLQIVAGNRDIASGASLLVTRTYPQLVLYETSDGTPSLGDEWGPQSGSFKLRSAGSGFCIVGIVDSTNGVAICTRKYQGSGTHTTTTVVTNVQCIDGRLCVETTQLDVASIGTVSDCEQSVSTAFSSAFTTSDTADA